MRPAATTYRLANPGGEFNKLYALARKVGVKVSTGELNWPTVLAERDGKVIAFLSTLPVPGAVVAGPLVIADPKITTILRLGEAYEVVLKTAGVQTYLTAVDKAHAAYVKLLEKVGYVKLQERENDFVLKKDIT